MTYSVRSKGTLAYLGNSLHPYKSHACAHTAGDMHHSCSSSLMGVCDMIDQKNYLSKIRLQTVTYAVQSTWTYAVADATQKAVKVGYKLLR